MCRLDSNDAAWFRQVLRLPNIVLGQMYYCAIDYATTKDQPLARPVLRGKSQVSRSRLPIARDAGTYLRIGDDSGETAGGGLRLEDASPTVGRVPNTPHVIIPCFAIMQDR